MDNRFYSKETAFIKVSRNGNEKMPTIQIKSFLQYLRAVTFPYKVLWENRPLGTKVIIQVPENYKDPFFEIAKQKLKNFTIKEITEKEVDEINNSVSGILIPDQHSCSKMEDVQNDISEAADIFINYEIDGWQLVIDLIDRDSINLPIDFCPFCRKKLR